jgi:hypothetical protein
MPLRLLEVGGVDKQKNLRTASTAGFEQCRLEKGYGSGMK